MSAPDSANDAVIRLRGVQHSFGAQKVLDGLDLDVHRGTNLVIMGLSGTGKSVTLKAMCGLLRPDAGEVVVDGIALHRARRRELSRARDGMGFLFQSAALINWLSAVDNVALPLLENGVARREARATALRKLDEVGLADMADKFPAELSGGMRKRVGFARAVARDPAIILYDEPTTGLDPVTKATIDELIVRGRDEFGATGVVVSHDLRSSLRVADRIGLLYEGRLVVDATPDAFVRDGHPLVRQFVEDNGRES